jgi:ornithine cyclodeaminase/alanine dehydrogenase-like protein (mu-crystallin family)
VPAYVTEAQVAELLTPAVAFAAVEDSFRRLARGAVENPPRLRAELPGGVFAVMPCVDLELGYAGLKTYAWLPGGTPFLVVLFSIAEARLAAVVEAELLGRLRTAAASAVAAARLARPAARTLGVFGTGRQAGAHVEALRAALPSLEEVHLVGRDAGLGDRRAAAACDVVVTATTAREPVVHGDWLSEGAFVCAIGANDPDSRELDDAVFERASFVCCDSRAQSRLESGDLIAAPVDWADVHELQDVVAGAMPGRTDDAAIAVFKSNGLAAWDLAAAARVVELAAAGGKRAAP